MRDYFAEMNADAGLIRRGKDFRHIYLDTAGPEPERPPLYIPPDAHLTRDERATIIQTNTCRAIQGRDDIGQDERLNIIVRVRQPDYIPAP